MEVRTRFAPSPTGFMHVGNLRTCLYGYLFAKKHNGKFILRIEDTDQERYVEGATQIIYNTLKMAGIEHDEGPDKDGGYGPYIQSERKPLYLEYAKKLVELGGAYYCFCDKERLDSLAGENGIKKYDKHCLKLTKEEIQAKLDSGMPYVIRQNIPEQGVSSYTDMVFGEISVPNCDMEDGVLIKSDGMPTYNFANVVDDHLMKINYVIRGMEYLSSTPKYNLMYDAFGWERPNYMHLPPIMRDATHKLSKRHGDANFEDFLEKGYLVDAIVNYIALLGWAPSDNREKMSMQELMDAFDVKGVSKSGSILDEAKMKWLNSQYIKELSVEEFVKLATPFFAKSKIAGKYDYNKLAVLLIPRVEILSDIPAKVDFLEEFEGYDKELYENKKNKMDKQIAIEILEKCIPEFEKLNDWTEEAMQNLISEIIEQGRYKKGQVFLTIRLALTGAQMTPGGATEMADLLGKAESIRRLKYSLEYLKG
ncbi:MAG: glutamate--tRNA ligase [Clostridia bacterium]|nr:glutamate--tRNA ligase [Clostridia bacterium]